MKYKLTFIKISPEHKFAGVGFAGNIFIILNALTYLTENDTLFVDMETNECVCKENLFDLFKTNNCWEYYFTQNKIEDNEEYINMNWKMNLNIKYNDNYLDLSKYIYLKKVATEEEAKSLLVSKFNNKYKSKLWVLSVNNK